METAAQIGRVWGQKDREHRAGRAAKEKLRALSAELEGMLDRGNTREMSVVALDEVTAILQEWDEATRGEG